MKLTIFETDFLGITAPNRKKQGLNFNQKGFNPYVIRLFHTLLQKVEMDPYRQWTHDLLRNYVNASYIFCRKLNKILDFQGQKLTINKYDAEDECLKVFFTGLYTSETYQGLKNGLYFVGTRQSDEYGWNLCVMTRKEIFETTKEFNGKDVLRQINHRDSFENELVSHEALYIKDIKWPDIISPNFANDIIEELKLKLTTVDNILKENDEGKPFLEISQRYKDFISNNLKGKNIEINSQNKSTIIDILRKTKDKIKGNNWLHILRDGIDNLPTDFVKSFFDKLYEDPDPKVRNDRRKEWIEECIKKSNDVDISFQCFQEIMKDTMQLMVDESNIHNLPAYFYIEGLKGNSSKEKIAEEIDYNYLLPMYLLNSGKPDFCIVLRHIKDKNGNYTGDWEPVTSLNMDEVYCDIRVFGKDAVERVRDWW